MKRKKICGLSIFLLSFLSGCGSSDAGYQHLMEEVGQASDVIKGMSPDRIITCVLSGIVEYLPADFIAFLIFYCGIGSFLEFLRRKEDLPIEKSTILLLILAIPGMLIALLVAFLMLK